MNEYLVKIKRVDGSDNLYIVESVSSAIAISKVLEWIKILGLIDYEITEITVSKMKVARENHDIKFCTHKI